MLADLLSTLIGFATDMVELGLQAPGLAMTEHEAEAVAQPAARMLARTGRGKALVKYLGSKGDAVALAAALMMYGERVAPVVMDRVALQVQRTQVQRAERANRGQTIPAAGASRQRSGERSGSNGKPAARADAAASIHSTIPTVGANGNGSLNGFASADNGGAPLAHVLADPLAPNDVVLYPGGIRPAA